MSRKYCEIRIRLIVDGGATETHIKKRLTQVLQDNIRIDGGEVDCIAKIGNEITVNEQQYAVPLPVLEDFTIPEPK